MTTSIRSYAWPRSKRRANCGSPRARPLLFEVLEDEDEDEISSAALWSLSQIGGEDARLYLQNLLDLAEDEEQVQFLEDALDNLEFTDELNRFDLMAIDPDQE